MAASASGSKASGATVGDLLAMLGERVCLRIEAAGLPGRMIGPDDHAGDDVAAVADPGDVPPGVGGVGGMDADRGAMNASLGLAGVLPCAARVVQDELVGGQRDRLADRPRARCRRPGRPRRPRRLARDWRRRSSGSAGRPRRRPAGGLRASRLDRPFRSSSLGRRAAAAHHPGAS